MCPACVPCVSPKHIPMSHPCPGCVHKTYAGHRHTYNTRAGHKHFNVQDMFRTRLGYVSDMFWFVLTWSCCHCHSASLPYVSCSQGWGLAYKGDKVSFITFFFLGLVNSQACDIAKWSLAAQAGNPSRRGHGKKLV